MGNNNQSGAERRTPFFRRGTQLQPDSHVLLTPSAGSSRIGFNKTDKTPKEQRKNNRPVSAGPSRGKSQTWSLFPPATIAHKPAGGPQPGLSFTVSVRDTTHVSPFNPVLGSIVRTFACVPKLLSVHGQSAFGDSQYRPRMSHIWDQRRVVLRPGLHVPFVSVDALRPPSTDDGWVEVTRSLRRGRGKVSNHSSSDLDVLGRFSEVRTDAVETRPAVVVGMNEDTVTLVVITSLSGDGFFDADRFTRLVSHPVLGTAEAHETFDFDHNGRRVVIRTEPVGMGARWMYVKAGKETVQYILLGAPLVVKKTDLRMFVGSSDTVGPECLGRMIEIVKKHISPALAERMHL